ncbi:hypothetical protein COLO4_29933 [Corchorus olitorius]|uniref:Uncharacterized protein n=1 Tax=Corchorus olitorius TaxID=93759 RepID=A0A1R3HCE4_9ROSI|nr:hypothetical protein COLO4_29933 [Corchorus olitorius]
MTTWRRFGLVRKEACDYMVKGSISSKGDAP